MKALLNLKEQALKSLGEITFKVADVETKASKTGNVGYRVKSSDGKVITFWSSIMDKVVEEIDEETYRVIPGTQITDEGSLIPRDNISGGFWS